MNNELYHHGIKGQKWGVRRYQNEDGSLTREGKRQVKLYRYKDKETKSAEKYYDKQTRKLDKKIFNENNKSSVNNEKIKELTQKRKMNLELKSKEIAAISKMSYNDMKKEKRKVIASGIAKVAAPSVLGLSLGALTGTLSFSTSFFRNSAEGIRSLSGVNPTYKNILGKTYADSVKAIHDSGVIGAASGLGVGAGLGKATTAAVPSTRKIKQKSRISEEDRRKILSKYSK